MNDSANRRAQIIASQALREAAAAPTNWRAARKRRPFSARNGAPHWSQSKTETPAPAADSSDGQDAKD